MKKNTTTYILLIMACAILFLITKYYSLESDKLRIEENLSTSHRELTELRNLITVNDTAVDKTIQNLNDQIDNYKFIVNKWCEYDFYNVSTSELLVKSYDVEAIVHTANGSFPLPKNGKIIVDSDFVELDITIVKPPHFEDDDVNERIHIYDDILDDVYYDSYDSDAKYSADDDTINIKYSNLVYGDKKDLYFYDELLRLLGLLDTNVQIIITDEHSYAEEYQPKNIKKKEFSGGYSNLGFTHNFSHTSDNSWVIDFNEVADDFVLRFENDQARMIKYEYDDAIKVTEICKDGEDFTSYERIVLPEVIQLGASWSDHSRSASITAIDYPLKTIYGMLDTVEVTYRSEQGFEEYQVYYAKEIGMVSRHMYNSEDVLVDVKYYD